VRIGSALTDEQIDGLTDDELQAWSDAEAVGQWQPNHAALRQVVVEELAVRLPADLLAELRAEAALHHQPAQRYVRDLLLLGLRLVQAGRARRRGDPPR
jgi:hypothetical protein